jgi:hypothetical protein
MLIRRVLLVLAIAIGVLATHGEAQTPAGQPKFLGRIVGVFDDRSGNPLDSVEVSDLTSKSSALTTSTGTLSLFFVDSAGGLLRFRKLGYKPLTMFVENGSDLAPLTITLEPLAQNLPTVVTVDSAPRYMSSQLKGFEERRKAGIGKFVPEAIVRKEQDRTLGNIIKAHVTGIDVREMRDPSTGRFVTIASTTRSGAPCPVDVFLDGVFISASSTSGGSAIQGMRGRGTRAGGVTNDLAEILPINLAAIEFYTTATVPPEFNRMGSGCGALLLWTRER